MVQEYDEKEAVEFKAKVTITDLNDDKMLADLAQQFDVHPSQITDWKMQLLERFPLVFGEKPAKESGAGMPSANKMIDRNHDLPVVRRCQILELARSTAY